jgi:Ca2+-transporting ATPase
VIFSNIRKVILFLMSGGLAQVLLILMTIVLLLPLPLLPAQIIWMNLVTSSFQAIALAFEPAERGIERQPPRPRDEPVLSPLILQRLAVMGLVMAIGTLAVFAWDLSHGADVVHDRTMALTVLVMFQLINVFNVRSET